MYGCRFISPSFFPTFFLMSHVSCIIIMSRHHFPVLFPSFLIRVLRPFSYVFCVLQGALIGEEPMLEDLAEVDPTVHCSLEWILDHDITEVHTLIGLLDREQQHYYFSTDTHCDFQIINLFKTLYSLFSSHLFSLLSLFSHLSLLSSPLISSHLFSLISRY